MNTNNKFPLEVKECEYKGEHYSARDDDEDCMITDSLTPLAAQYHWTTPTEFPCCPNVINDEGLLIYKENLKEGRVFTSNKYDTYYVVDKGKWTDGDELIILATNKDNTFLSWSIVSVKIRKGKYVHTSIKRTLGKDLSTKFFKALIGEGTLSSDELNTIDCL